MNIEALIEGQYQKKDKVLLFFKANPQLFADLVEASLYSTNKKSWRYTLLIGHLIKKNDTRILPYISAFIEVLAASKIDGQQRQILVILDKMKFTEDQEGELFNICMTIWETISKIPSTRIRAFWMMERISLSYPELKQELRCFVTPYYTETLSPGIKKYITKKYCN